MMLIMELQTLLKAKSILGGFGEQYTEMLNEGVHDGYTEIMEEYDNMSVGEFNNLDTDTRIYLNELYDLQEEE